MSVVLFVEDNIGIVESILPSFQLSQVEIRHASNLKEAKKHLLAHSFSAVILDINLPDGSGLDLCKEIHEAFPSLPIVMLTARDEDATVVKSLSLGAIDYVRKPFSHQELVARVIRAISREVISSKEIRFGLLSVDAALKGAVYDGQKLSLTRRELDLLALLAKRAGTPASRREILEILEDDGEINDRTIDSHISNLRRKLKRASKNQLSIKAQYGLGYHLEGK